MPKLCNFKTTHGSGDDCARVSYEVWEDEDGHWHGVMTIKVEAAHDALDAAHSIAEAMRQLNAEPPGHSTKCKCLLCTEWRTHDARARLDA